MTLPTDAMVANLKAGVSQHLLGIGDSTLAGVGDATYSGGWPPRFSKMVGAYCNCKVKYGSTIIYTPPSGGNGATFTYSSPVGGPGTTWANDLARMPSQFPPVVSSGATPDVVILWGGINDFLVGGVTSATIGATVEQVLTAVRSYFGDPQIILSDESPTKLVAPFGAMFGHFSSQSALPLIPVLYPADPVWGKLWCLDSWQAFGYMGSVDTLGASKWYYDGLHPNSAGYDVMAQWMFDLLIGNTILSPPVGDAPLITTTSLSSMTLGVPLVPITLTATGTTPITWSVISGSLPAGVTLFPTGVISGTPTAATTYDFTVRATNTISHADQRYTGTVNSVIVYPFDPNTVGRLKYRMNGQYYSVPMSIRVTS